MAERDPDIVIRKAREGDSSAIWKILEPTIRAGETCAIPRDITEDQAIAFWTGSDRETFVVEEDGRLLGTYYLRANQPAAGSHVANCGYITALNARGRGIARMMGLHSLDWARSRGYRAMQFNLVVSTNEVAARLWKSLGFEVIGVLPGEFLHPEKGYVDAFVMFQTL